MAEARTFSLTTLGCRLNQAESDLMAEQLRGAGLRDADGGPSDVVVVNTCTVTREATKASRMAIRRAIKKNPDARVVAIGCYAVSNPEEVRAIEGVAAVLSNDDKEDFVSALGRSQATGALLQIGPPRKAAPLQPRIRANLKVQTGCDEWCTFCIIPTTRGPLRSMDENALVREARARVDAGARELVLTGVHLGKYMYDRGGDESDLLRLFERLLDIEGLWRLRLSSVLSRHLTDDVVKFIAAESRICRYLHVPLQSGDDGVLRDMHRPYSIGEYMESVMRAKETIPGVALATDIIVGFPTESDEAFEATMDIVRRVQHSKLHVFRYSPRPQTAAADMHDEVPPEIKRERSKALIDLGNEIRARFLQAHMTAPLEVLVEDERDVDGAGVCSGQTSDYVRVWFEGKGHLGSMAPVEGRQIRADGIQGVLAGAGTKGKEGSS